MKKTVISKTPDDTRRFARELAATARAGQTYALYGDLGAGKTTFTQAFAKTLGVKERLQSPTFILLHEHRLAKPKRGIAILAHADAYRADAEQFRAIGIEEYLGREDAVLLIEWAERVEELLPEHVIRVTFRHKGGDAREITIA